MSNRVVITGIGVCTSLGLDKDAFWKALTEGKSNVAEITSFDTSNYSTKFAAQVKDFNPEDYIPKKEARRLDRFLQFAVASTDKALKDANLQINPDNADTIGVSIGSGIGGMSVLEDQFRVLFEKGPQKISPFFIPMMISNMASGYTAIHFGAKGPNITMVTACATGAHSIGEASEIIKRGQAEIMIAGGAEAAITPISVAGFSSMRALSTRNDAPNKASRPFDKDRDGFVMGEGSGVIILENLEFAKKRGANIYAEIVGFGMSADANHITTPDPEGDGAARAMGAAIKSANISSEVIDYINSHGTSTPLGDKTETLAIKKVFGERAHKISISSSKSMLGHTLGAAGAVESIVCVLTIKNNLITPTINLETPDPECDLDYTPNVSKQKEVNYAMNNSFGFGGQNAVLIFKKYT